MISAKGIEETSMKSRAGLGWLWPLARLSWVMVSGQAFVVGNGQGPAYYFGQSFQHHVCLL